MARRQDFVPVREAELDSFVHNFDQRITAAPVPVGLTAAQATAFHALVVAWDAAYAVTKVKATRCTAACIVKDDRKFDLVKNLRELARIIQAFPGTTDEQRSLLGLTVPVMPQSQPAPAVAPLLNILRVVGNVISLDIRDSQNVARLRPDFAKSVNIFSYVGANPPTTGEGWFLQGGTTRSRVDVAFDTSLPVGTKVYLTACFKNERDMTGPACQPVAVTLMGGGVLPSGLKQTDGHAMSIAA
ncbi:MAG TPA: hypothetical protein VGB55_06790 [Tepidisphaeraceae bacterium]|jgi:hypothetical protein